MDIPDALIAVRIANNIERVPCELGGAKYAEESKAWAEGQSGRADLAALDLHQPLGQGFVVAAGKPVRISSRATPVRLPETMNARAFSCSMWHGARRSEMGRVAPRLAEAF